jgi:hypothetical protein
MRLQAHTESMSFSLSGEDHVSVREKGTLPEGPVLQLSEYGWGDASEANDRFGLLAAVSWGRFKGPLWAVPVQAGKVCNHRASPNRHLSSIPRNGYSPANMQCAARATARRDPLVDGKLEHQLMTAFEKIHPSFPSAVKGPQWADSDRGDPTDTRGALRTFAARKWG